MATIIKKFGLATITMVAALVVVGLTFSPSKYAYAYDPPPVDWEEDAGDPGGGGVTITCPGPGINHGCCHYTAVFGAPCKFTGKTYQNCIHANNATKCK